MYNAVLLFSRLVAPSRRHGSQLRIKKFEKDLLAFLVPKSFQSICIAHH